MLYLRGGKEKVKNVDSATFEAMPAAHKEEYACLFAATDGDLDPCGDRRLRKSVAAYILDEKLTDEK